MHRRRETLRILSLMLLEIIQQCGHSAGQRIDGQRGERPAAFGDLLSCQR
jgi:hypothetical protein